MLILISIMCLVIAIAYIAIGHYEGTLSLRLAQAFILTSIGLVCLATSVA